MSTPDPERVRFWIQELEAYGGLLKWEKRNSYPIGLRNAVAFERAARLVLESRWRKEIERLTDVEHRAQDLIDAWTGDEKIRIGYMIALRRACYPEWKGDE